MDDSFLSALFPARHRLLGRALRPYCYGHLVTLHAIGSPLVAAAGAGDEVDAGQLLAAVRVCAAPGWPLLPPDALRPRLRDVLVRAWLERRPGRLRRAVDAFLAYRDDHDSFPAFYEEENLDPDGVGGAVKARLLTAPAALVSVVKLVHRTTLTWEEAWNLPVALPSWIAGTLGEMEGGARFDAGDQEEDDELPDLTQLSEAELYRLAVQQMGKANADAWRKQRRAAARREKRQQSKHRQGAQPGEEHAHGS